MLALLVLAGVASCVSGQLVTYPNGAVVPYDPANQAATAAHLATTGYGYAYPYAGYPYLYGRKKREADPQLVTYPNGAVVPYDPANQAATAAHLASKAYAAYPYAGYPYLYGRKKREAEADAQLVTYSNGAVVPYDPANQAATAAHLAVTGQAAYGYAYPYAGYPYLYGRKRREAEADAQLVTYSNGAVVPYDPANQAATATHLAVTGQAAYGYAYPYAGYPYLYGRKRREADADAQLLYAAALPYAYAPYPYTPLVAHPNGALVPLEPAEVVKARAEHLAAKAATA